MRNVLLFFVMFTALTVPATDVLRTVYFSASDASGAAVTDLTAADLAVKEGGKDRVVAGVERATAPLQVVLLVDDAGTGAFQGAVAQFLQALFGRGQFAIYAFNPQPIRLTDFTEDAGVLRTALDGIGPRGRIATTGEQMAGAVEEAANALLKRKAPRAAIIVLTAGGELPQSNQADSALSALKRSGASLTVVHVAGLQLGQVLGDGPKRSGGTVLQIGGSVVPGPVLAKVADNLLNQYTLTYTLPDGVKPNERFSLTTNRKGVTLLAPSRLPDK